MGLSNYIPSSRIAQSGVCTSSTRPATPYEGQVIFETDTDRMLIWNGTTWVIPNAPAQNPTGLELVTTQTLSGTSTQINTCFTSTYNSYRIVFSNLTFSTESLLTMRLVAGTTPDQTNNYYASGLQVITGGAVSSIGNNAVSYWHTALSASPTAGGCFVELFNPQLSVPTAFSGQGIDTRTNGAPHRTSGGFFNASTSFDGLWVSTLNGTYTLGGTIRVYGYRN